MASFALKFPRGVVWYCFDIGFGIGIGIGIYGILNGMWSKTFQEKCQILKQEDTTANRRIFFAFNNFKSQKSSVLLFWN